jgi:peptide-methionine (S)-S-oxide reductase
MPPVIRWSLGAWLLALWLIMVPAAGAATTEQAVFGGGCFWAFQAEFELLRGVRSAEPGYAGGRKANPSYDEVCTGTTGHAEVIRVTYDPQVISYDTLLRAFFGAHDPTSLNRQGNDEGEQYRSIILPANAAQAQAARAMIKSLTAAKAHAKPIVTEIQALQQFYPADSYHQHYYERHPDEPYCRYVVAKEIAHFRRSFGPLLSR